MTKLEEQMKYLTFLKEVVKRDIKRKYYKSALGVLWTVLNPLLSMLVMTLVFSTLFKRNIDNYPIYLLCGQLIFNFMSGSTRQSLGAILNNAGYIRSIYIPKYIFVLSRVVEGFVDLLFSLIALVVVMLFTHALDVAVGYLLSQDDYASKIQISSRSEPRHSLYRNNAGNMLRGSSADREIACDRELLCGADAYAGYRGVQRERKQILLVCIKER